MKKMKMITVLALTGAMLLGLAGCGAKEKPLVTYTSKAGNISIDLPGDDFEELESEDIFMNLNNGKYAYAVLQFPKHQMEIQDIYTFDSFVTMMNDRLIQEFNITESPDVSVTTPNMISSVAKKFDLTDTTIGTQALMIYGETESAYYQLTIECAEKDYNEEKFNTIFNSIKELSVTAPPEETIQTYTSESGKFSIDLPGEWIEELDTGAGAIYTKGNVSLMIEQLSKEQVATLGPSTLDEFVDFMNNSDEGKLLIDSCTVTEETFEPGKYIAANASIFEGNEDDNSKLLIAYLESESSYICFKIIATKEGYDTEIARYIDIIQNLVEM